jgi:hypothetical protein
MFWDFSHVLKTEEGSLDFPSIFWQQQEIVWVFCYILTTGDFLLIFFGGSNEISYPGLKPVHIAAR